MRVSNEQRTTRRAESHELAVSAQSNEWKDRQHHVPRRLASFLVVLAALTGCVALAVIQIQNRIVAHNRVELDRVSVTTVPVVLTSAASGRVTDLKATVGGRVKAGDVLATIEVLPATTQSGTLDIVAPVDAIVQEISAVAGGTVASGTQFIRLYQPGKMFFEAPLAYKSASKIQVGSKAVFNVPGLGNIDATVAGVRADFNTDVEQTNVRTARLVFEPTDAASLQAVVPGLIAKGHISTNTAAADAPRAVLNPRF
jgi:multidrug resistance efflux pump